MVHDFSPSPASRRRDVARILKEMKSFAAFDRWFDDELDRLVAQWIHTAAPNALRQWRVPHRLGRK